MALAMSKMWPIEKVVSQKIVKDDNIAKGGHLDMVAHIIKWPPSTLYSFHNNRLIIVRSVYSHIRSLFIGRSFLFCIIL